MTIDELKTMLEKTIPADGVPVTHPKVLQARELPDPETLPLG